MLLTGAVVVAVVDDGGNISVRHDLVDVCSSVAKGVIGLLDVAENVVVVTGDDAVFDVAILKWRIRRRIAKHGGLNGVEERATIWAEVSLVWARGEHAELGLLERIVLRMLKWSST